MAETPRADVLEACKALELRVVKAIDELQEVRTQLTQFGQRLKEADDDLRAMEVIRRSVIKRGR